MSSHRIPDAIRRSMAILETHRALFGGRAGGPRKHRPISGADISGVIGIFRTCDARWVLVGAHAVGLVTEPRATADFDFIVDGAKLVSIVGALAERFGDLDAHEIGAAIELKAIDVDLIRSTNHALFAAALERPRRVGDWNVPRTEALIALKFLAAVSPWRNRDKRAQDIVDLRATYSTVGAEHLDVTEMVRLAGMAYPDAEREFKAMLDKIDRGEPIAI